MQSVTNRGHHRPMDNTTPVASWRERPAPAFWLTLGANWLVATLIWVTGVTVYGADDFFDYHIGVWVLPVLIVLTVTGCTGLTFLFIEGRRRVGAAVLAAATIAGIMDLLWAFAVLLDRIE